MTNKVLLVNHCEEEDNENGRKGNRKPEGAREGKVRKQKGKGEREGRADFKWKSQSSLNCTVLELANI